MYGVRIVNVIQVVTQPLPLELVLPWSGAFNTIDKSNWNDENLIYNLIIKTLQLAVRFPSVKKMLLLHHIKHREKVTSKIMVFLFQSCHDLRDFFHLRGRHIMGHRFHICGYKFRSKNATIFWRSFRLCNSYDKTETLHRCPTAKLALRLPKAGL